MIISVSRRTDIPAFYSQWFINRVRAGFCTVPNPIYPEKLSVVSLQPSDVGAFVFCSRNPRPLLRFLPELDGLGYRYYLHQTLVENPRAIDPHSPPLEAALRTFRAVAEHVGPARMVWRYDPIVVSELTPVEYHRQKFARIARALRGHTGRVVVSILDPYNKTRGRLAALANQGIHLETRQQIPEPLLGGLMRALVETAADNDMEIVSCAEEPGLEHYGIHRGKCMDDELLARACGVHVAPVKNPAMRPACGCVVSRDIGMYDACLFGCAYCYATSSFTQARANHAAHDPASPSLLGWHEAPGGAPVSSGQMSLFGEIVSAPPAR